MKKRRGLEPYLTTISTWNQGSVIAQNLFVTTRHKPYCPLKNTKVSAVSTGHIGQADVPQSPGNQTGCSLKSARWPLSLRCILLSVL